MNPIFPEAPELVNAYLADDVITWSVSGGTKRQRKFVGKTFRKIERRLGIDFKKGADPITGESEIDFEYVNDDFIDPDFGTDWLGVATVGFWGDSEIIVKKGIDSWKSTAVHEILHSLGLDHDHDVIESAMSYTRDYSKHKIYDYDWNNLETLYGEFV